MKGIFLTDLEHAIYLHNQRNELFIHTVIHIQIEFLEMDHKQKFSYIASLNF